MAVALDGIPRFWATVHDLTQLASLAEGSRRQTVSAIDAFYNHVADMYGDDVLDRLLADLNIDAITSGLEAFLVREHNLAAVGQRDIGVRWSAASQFVLSTVRNIAAARGLLQEVDGFRQRLLDLERRVRQMSSVRRPRTQTLRALPSGVLEDLYEIFDASNERNPFKGDAERLRNFTLFHVLLHCGLRAGEALLLPVGCVRTEHDPSLLRDRHWMTIRDRLDGTEPDPRAVAPSLKNAYALRQIPVTDHVAALIRAFSSNHRRPGHDTDALFLSSRGRPLSQRMLEAIMARANSALSQDARTLLADQRGVSHSKFTAHDLRHTCAVTRLNALRKHGVGEEEALSKLRIFFGWSHGSQMPRHYARAYWESELGRVWNDAFDEHVEVLRELESAW